MKEYSPYIHPSLPLGGNQSGPFTTLGIGTIPVNAAPYFDFPTHLQTHLMYLPLSFSHPTLIPQFILAYWLGHLLLLT